MARSAVLDRRLRKFKRYCQEYIDKFGLTEWEVKYEIQSMPTAYGRTFMNQVAGRATIIVDTDPTLDEDLKFTARHEVLHILLNPLLHEARERFTSDEVIESAAENILRRLEKLIK